MTDRLPTVAVLLEGVVGNQLGAGVYRSWVEALGLHGDERVLDVGTGAGACARHLAAALQRGGVLTGVDIDGRWLAIARRRLSRFRNVELVEADACDWARAGAYDAATMHFVLHDIPDDRRLQAVRNVAASLRPGGRLYLREPVSHGMTAEEMTALLRQAGLQRVGEEVLGNVPLMGLTVSAVWEKAG